MSAALSKPELLEHLAGGHAAAVTVVTPNRRLAQALAADFDRAQGAAGHMSWETADILPFGAFAARLYDDALYAEGGAELPRLLSPDEERCLWEAIVGESHAALLSVGAAAERAREAWQLAQAWRLEARLKAVPLDADATAWAGWAARYALRTQKDRLTDAARLPDIAARALGHARTKLPKRLVAYGFGVVTPQQQALFDALAARGTALARSGPVAREARQVRVPCVDARAEVALAARWARARLEANPQARIGVVCPDLAALRPMVERTFRRTLAPGGSRATLPFDLSLGTPLAAQPVVAHALAALELGGRDAEFSCASLVLRSPFIGEAEAERAPRARADAALRAGASPRITLDALAAGLEGAPRLAARLGAYARFRREQLFGRQAPRAWAEAFDGALRTLGFPGERSPDSAEYQALARWHELLADFARTERVAGPMGFHEALARLSRMAQAVVFQPETPEVPIQVLGLLEAAGLEFDHLWVMGLSSEAWPPKAHVNAFLPTALLREAGVPWSTPGDALHQAQVLTAGWRAAAAELVLSHPENEGDRRLAPSALIASVPEGALELPETRSWRDVIHAARRLERIEDARAPAFDTTQPARGGAGLIASQAACPFRAFAAHRLASAPLDAPHAGLDAMERGALAHRVLAAVWAALKTKAAFDAMPAAELDALVGRAADAAIARARRQRPGVLDGRYAAIEHARLARLAREWLEVERGRAEFTVLAREDRRALAIGPLQLTGQLDRVDETPEGRIVIDYKTGKPSVGVLLGPRPDEPQLPLYLVAGEPEAVGIAFAQVRTGDMKFTGLARAKGLLPGARTLEEVGRRQRCEADWTSQVAFWSRELTRLATAFAEGDAVVDPKDPRKTCTYCEQQPFCRIAERAGGEAGDEADAGS